MDKNVFSEFHALADKIRLCCFRVLRCDSGFIVVYPQIDSNALLDMRVSILSNERVEYDLIRETPCDLLVAYCEVKSLLEEWSGDYASFPIPETSPDVLKLWYGEVPPEGTED